jgi:sulfur carrier protein
MNIQINGEKFKIPPEQTLVGLVKKIHPKKQRVAVLLNGNLIPTDKQSACTLKEGDRVEILTFAGGG